MDFRGFDDVLWPFAFATKAMKLEAITRIHKQ